MQDYERYTKQIHAAGVTLEENKMNLPSLNTYQAEVKSVATLKSDMEFLKTWASPLFADGLKPEYIGERMAESFTKFEEESRPSLSALMLHAQDKLGLSDQETPEFNAAMMSALAADVPNTNGYHNNQHFLEVTSFAIRLFTTHNNLVSKGELKEELLDEKDFGKLMLAASGHDLLHDGLGNAPEGEHLSYRLEKQAAELVDEFAQLSGMSDQGRDDVRTMLLVTDVTGDPSPHSFLKEAAKFHLEGEDIDFKKFPEELQGLSNRSSFLLSAIMSDADLAPSALTTPAYNQRQTHKLSQEAGIAEGPETTKFFLENIVGGSMTSPSGQVYNSNIDNMLVDANQKLAQKADNTPRKPKQN